MSHQQSAHPQGWAPRSTPQSARPQTWAPPQQPVDHPAAAHLSAGARRDFTAAVSYLLPGETVQGVWAGTVWDEGGSLSKSAMGVLVVTSQRVIASGSTLGVRISRQILLTDVVASDFHQDALRLVQGAPTVVVTGAGGHRVRFTPKKHGVAAELAPWILAMRQYASRQAG